MKIQFRLNIVYKDGSGSHGIFNSKEDAMVWAQQLIPNLPIGARLELTIIIFSEPEVLFTK